MRLARWTVLAALLVAGDPTVASAQPCGDADGSATVDVIDAANVARAAVGLPSACTARPESCDVDGSGAIDVIDAANVARAAVGLPSVCPRCARSIVTVALTTAMPVAAAGLVLDYPETRVGIPGSGDDPSVLGRIEVVAAAELFGGGAPNDQDDRILFTLIALEGLGSGAVLRVTFDCVSGVAAAADFVCTLADAVGTDGVTPITDATCSVAVA